MAGAGKKTFTAGETLTASDVNTYLMEQSVMYFAGTAARASAIPTPSTGMTSYIGVTGTATIPQLETYTGSAWQTPYGSTLVANVSFSGASAVNIDNVFTSTYQNYKLVFNFTASTISAGAGIAWRGRTGGSTIATGIYFSQYVRGTGTTVNAFTGGDAALGGISSLYPTYVQFETHLASPQLAQVTTSTTACLYTDGAGGGNTQLICAWANGTNQFDGIAIAPTSGTITGTVRIYGLRNS
jgi:hypothetical protein